MDGSWLMAVDGTGLYVRCERAARKTGLTGPDGTPTGPLTLFANALASMVRPVQPKYLLVVWDGGEGNKWRQKIAPEYKASRWHGEATRDLRPFDAVREFCNAAQIEQWCFDEFEGDDMLAAACRQSRRGLPETQVMICADDKDVIQLAETGRVWLRSLGRDGILADASTLELAHGVPPRLFALFRALSGDASDGIPGLPGIGPVKAARMIQNSPDPRPAAFLAEGPERDQVERWLSIMDLNHPPQAPEDHKYASVLNIRRTEWTRGNVLPVLEKYGMNAMAGRVNKGSFW